MAAANFTSTTIIADEQFIERQRLFEDFLASDVTLSSHGPDNLGSGNLVAMITRSG